MAAETIYEWMERTGFFDRFLLIGALAGPLIAAVLAYLLRDKPAVEHHKSDWLLAVIAGPIVYLMWRGYNAIMDRYGLETLTASGLALLMFLAAAAGVAGMMRIMDQQFDPRRKKPGRATSDRGDLTP